MGNDTLWVTSATAVWHKTGVPAVPIHWVLILDPQGKFEPQALLRIDLTAHPHDIFFYCPG
ncbi:MAG: hypothetical protein AAFU78_16585 [Cyanobacteria bacterium J06633_2]